VRQLEDATRCFVYITNVSGETLAVAIEGPHGEQTEDDTVFAPRWLMDRLDLNDGDEVIMDAILDALPSGETVTIRPLTGSTVEGPMFLEGLTEALNQLGVVQEGLLSAIVDPSMPIMHEFMIESLTPMAVCLADGELRVEMARALDRPETPPPPPVVLPVAMHVAMPAAMPTPVPSFNTMLPPAMVPPVYGARGGFIPFSGQGNRLG